MHTVSRPPGKDPLTGFIVSDGNTTTISGDDAIYGSDDLVKIGRGTLLLSAANIGFTGNLALFQGTLSLGNSLALGGGSITTDSSVIDYADSIRRRPLSLVAAHVNR